MYASTLRRMVLRRFRFNRLPPATRQLAKVEVSSHMVARGDAGSPASSSHPNTRTQHTRHTQSQMCHTRAHSSPSACVCVCVWSAALGNRVVELFFTCTSCTRRDICNQFRYVQSNMIFRKTCIQYVNAHKWDAQIAISIYLSITCPCSVVMMMHGTCVTLPSNGQITIAELNCGSTGQMARS